MRVTKELTIDLADEERWRVEQDGLVYEVFMVKYRVETGSAVVYGRRVFNNGRVAANGRPFFGTTYPTLPEAVQECIRRNS